jgi:ABC-2 type transport system permease protein
VIRAVIAKDVRLLLRDRGALVSLFALPLAFMLAFGLVVPSSAERRRPRAVPLWHAAGDPRGEAIARALRDAPGFAARAASSADDVRRAVATGSADAGLVVPAAPAPVELAIDLAAPLEVRGPLEAGLSAVVTGALRPAPAGPPTVISRAPPGLARPAPDASPFQIAVPANAVLFGFFLSLTVAMSLTADRRTGAWRRLLAAPGSRAGALLASLVPYFVVGAVQLGFLFGTGALVFGMRIGGSLAAVIALSLAVVYCAVALGLVFATVADTERQLGSIGAVTLLIMGLIAGCMVPRMAMPPAMRAVGLCVPHGWALDGYHAAIVRTGTALGDVLPSLIALLGFGTAFAVIGVARFRFDR